MRFLPDPVHEEGDNDDVDGAHLVDEELGVVEEGDGDQSSSCDGQTQQVDRGVQVFLHHRASEIQHVLGRLGILPSMGGGGVATKEIDRESQAKFRQ
jgi:hypothetical protein